MVAKQYIAKTREVAAPFSATLLHGARADRVLTGGAKTHGLTIIVSFPSLEKIDEWYASDAYQPLKALRDEGADMQMTSYEIME